MPKDLAWMPALGEKLSAMSRGEEEATGAAGGIGDGFPGLRGDALHHRASGRSVPHAYFFGTPTSRF